MASMSEFDSSVCGFDSFTTFSLNARQEAPRAPETYLLIKEIPAGTCAIFIHGSGQVFFCALFLSPDGSFIFLHTVVSILPYTPTFVFSSSRNATKTRFRFLPVFVIFRPISRDRMPLCRDPGDSVYIYSGSTFHSTHSRYN